MKVRKELKELIESGSIRADEYYFKKMTAPPLLSYISFDAIAYLNYIASSIKFSSKINYKYEQIERTVEQFGFVQLGRGTNRVTYRHLEDPRYVLKVAIDDVGIQDNPREFINQDYLYPFVAKVFEVDPTGTVALVERVEPIRHRVEFESIAGKVFELLRYWFTGKYVMEDIGSEFFMNWATRKFDGCPVLCDYPYMYELDYKKLHCQKLTPTGPCNGIIDYDAGYNRLICPKCGSVYRAKELARAISNNQIKIDKGEKVMNQRIVVSVTRNGETKRIESGTTGTSSVQARYNNAEQATKNAAKNIKARLNNMIMTEKKPDISDQNVKIAEAIKKTIAARKAVTTNVGDKIEEKNIKVEAPVEEKKPVVEPPIKEEPAKEESLADIGNELAKQMVENMIGVNDIKPVEEEKEPEEKETAEEQEEKESEDTKWDVQGNFIPKEIPEDDTPTEDDDEEPVDIEEDEEPREYRNVEVFGITGIHVDDVHAADLILPKAMFAYDLQGYEDEPSKPQYMSNEYVTDDWAGTVVLTAEVEFNEDSNFICFDADENDGVYAFKYTFGAQTLEEFIDLFLMATGGETDDNEDIDPEVSEACDDVDDDNENMESAWADESGEEDGSDEGDLPMVDAPVGAAPVNEAESEVSEENAE